MRGAPGLMAMALLAGCAGQPRLAAVDTRSEQVGHQRLQALAEPGDGGPQAYRLGASEGYRMPQLHAAPDPVLGEREPRRELAATTICLQVVVSAQGTVERSVPLTDRSECRAGIAEENAALLQAAQEAVAMWKYSAAAICHFAAGQVPADRGDCRGAQRIEPVPVSLLYAFTFEIVQGRQWVRRQQE